MKGARTTKIFMLVGLYMSCVFCAMCCQAWRFESDTTSGKNPDKVFCKLNTTEAAVASVRGMTSSSCTDLPARCGGLSQVHNLHC